MLFHEGLLTRGTRGGFFAPMISREDYEKVLEVRFAIEAGALRLMALKHLPKENLPKMRETCDVMDRMLQEDFELGFVEADRRFHELLVGMGQNERLEKVYSRAPLMLVPSMDTDRERRKKNLRRSLDEHRRLCELLEHGNIPEACKLLERHLFASHCLAKDTSGIERKTQ